jgi:hypothetical protein
MDTIRDQRAIVERRALAGRLAAIAERPPGEERGRAGGAEVRPAAGRAEVRRFEALVPARAGMAARLSAN